MGLLSLLKSKAGIRTSESGWNSESSVDDKEIQGFQKATAPSSNFLATSNLDVHAIGYDTNQALTGKTLENISVHRVESGQAEYVSLRQKKNSNSCALVRASDQDRTFISTIYRIGPGRHPRMHILPDKARVTVDAALHEWENSDKACADGVEAFAVASCILMLKREADRFIDNTVAAVV